MQRLRIPYRLFILYLVTSLLLGIGIGYLSRTGQVNSTNSDNNDLEQRIEVQSETIGSLSADKTALSRGLETQQAQYESLLDQYNDLSGQLASLNQSYQTLSGKYEIIQDEVDLATLDQVRKLTEQVTSLYNGNSLLSSQLSQAQIEITQFQAQINSISAINSALSTTLSTLGTEKTWLEKRVAQLEDQITPSASHAMTKYEVFGVFKSDPEWLGKDFALQQKAKEIGQLYNNTHIYIEGETDCNDMAADIWNMLYKEGIKSAIVVGDLDKTGETFEEITHAWLYVFDAEGKVIYMEPTTGEVIFGKTGDGENPRATPYKDPSSFIYEKPSDLRADLKTLMW